MTNKTNTPKQIKLIANIQANKELFSKIRKSVYKGDIDGEITYFIFSAYEYIKAIKTGAMMCKIDSVSKSGMSRNIKFFTLQKSKGQNKSYTRNFFAFFVHLGYCPTSKHSDCFRIGGCGMDMIFHTNYTIIHRLCRLGFMTKKECSKLAQNTPTII